MSGIEYDKQKYIRSMRIIIVWSSMILISVYYRAIMVYDDRVHREYVRIIIVWRGMILISVNYKAICVRL